MLKNPDVDLPAELLEAFRAVMEEVGYATP